MKNKIIVSTTVAAIASASASQTSKSDLMENKLIEDVPLTSPIEAQAERMGFCLSEDESKNVDAKEMLNSPTHFLQRFGLDFQSTACPEEAHKAFQRGSELSSKLFNSLKSKGLGEEVFKEFGLLAKENFGRYKVEVIPYGLKFIEEIYLPPGKTELPTASGSATVTFADGDADVDG